MIYLESDPALLFLSLQMRDQRGPPRLSRPVALEIFITKES